MTQLLPAAGLALLAALFAYGYYRTHRQQQAVTEAETVTTDDVSEGQVKLHGRIDPHETVTSPVTGEEAVVVDWSLRGQAESDDRSDKHVRGRRAATFDLVDDHGEVRVDPDGATLTVSDANTTTELDPNVSRDRIKAFANEIEDDFSGTDREDVTVEASGSLSVSGYRSTYDDTYFRDESLTADDEVYVVGNAHSENGEFVVGDGDGEFVISDLPEEEIGSDLGTKKWLLLALAAASAVGSLYYLVVA